MCPPFLIRASTSRYCAIHVLNSSTMEFRYTTFLAIFAYLLYFKLTLQQELTTYSTEGKTQLFLNLDFSLCKPDGDSLILEMDGDFFILYIPYRDCSPVSLFHTFLHTKPKGVSLFRRHGSLMENRSKPASISTLTMLLLLISGDIQLNPGPSAEPDTSVCPECNILVDWEEEGIECECCCFWYHRKCINMSKETYNLHNNHASLEWYCIKCDMPSFTSSLFGNLTNASATTMDDDFLDSMSNSSSSNNSSNNDESISRPMPSTQPKQRAAQRKSDMLKRPLRFLNINYRSIRSKLPTFEALIDSESPDVIVGTESWLNDNINTGEILPQSYQMFRRDRSGRSGGGVFIAIQNNLVAKAEPSLESDCEVVWASIHIKTCKPIYVGAFYRSQSTDTSYMEHLQESLDKLPNHAHVWLMGDFNLPDVNWVDNTFKPGGRYPGPSKKMMEIADNLNYQQIVDKPTRGNSILDLCFTSMPTLAQDVDVIAGISDHEIVRIDTLIKPQRSRPSKRKVYLFKRADMEGLADELNELNNSYRDEFVNQSTVEDLWTKFRDGLETAMDRHIPSKMSSSRFNLPWIDNSTRRAIRRKQRLYNKAKKSGSEESWNKFKTVRRSIDRGIRRAYKSYVSDVIGGSLSSNNTKPFWNFVKTKRQQAFGVGTLNTDNGIAASPKDKADALNRQFKSVFTNEDTSNLPDLDESRTPELQRINVTTEGVEKLLKDLQPQKAPGPDGITPRILKLCATSIAPILQCIFQKSLDTGVLPSDWLHANVVPIFKGGDSSLPSNYRPVSLTSVACKLLEHIICHTVMDHWEHNQVLLDNQHGFRKGRSCETQLAATIEDLAEVLDQRGQVDCIIMDFSKAFDTVPHQRLLKKLHHSGITGSLLSWMENFLTRRTQQVVLDGVTSDSVYVSSGVPQGTVLGPAMFLLYINDLPRKINSTVRLLADDCIMYKRITTQADNNILQQDINTLCFWQNQWLMKFNTKKCFSMTITHKLTPTTFTYDMGGVPLQSTDNHTYLGVLLNSKLNWNQHINKTTTKANKTLGLLRRNFHHCSTSVKSTAYKTLVRPQLEYCCTIWDPHHQTSIDRIEAVQNRAARFALGDYSRESSVTSMKYNLEWDLLEERRLRARLLLLYKAAN